MGVLEAKRLISQSAVLACFYHVIFSVCSAALYFISFFSFFLFNNFIIGICILSLLLIYQQKKNLYSNSNTYSRSFTTDRGR